MFLYRQNRSTATLVFSSLNAAAFTDASDFFFLKVLPLLFTFFSFVLRGPW